MSSIDAADSRDDSARRGAGPDARGDAADRRARNACRSRRRTSACSRARSSPARTCLPSRAPRWTATPSSRRTRFGAGQFDPKVLRLIEKVYTGQVPTQAVVSGRVHRDRHRRADAAGRRRGRDGRGDREGRPRRGPRVQPGLPGPERRPPGRGHPRRPGAARRRGPPHVQPRRARSPRSASTRWRCSRGRAWPSCPPATRSSRPASRSSPGQIYDINRFTLGAIIAEHGARARAAADVGRHARGPEPRARRGARRRPGHLLGRQFGRRARPDPGRHRGARRDRVPRHRGEAGQAHAVRHHRRASRSSACPATRPRACRTATC